MPQWKLQACLCDTMKVHACSAVCCQAGRHACTVIKPKQERDAPPALHACMHSHAAKIGKGGRQHSGMHARTVMRPRHRGVAGAARRLAQVQARALAAVEAAREEAARVCRELEALRQQFRAYQAMKAGEVAGLEARLRVALTQPHTLGLCSGPNASRHAAPPCRPRGSSSSAHHKYLLQPAPDNMCYACDVPEAL